MVPHEISTAPQQVADALRDFYLRSHRFVDRILSRGGPSYAQTRMLAYIAEKGTLRSVDLALYFGQAPRTVTEAIDGLERSGLVRRDPDPDDRRAKKISLTPAGIVAAREAEQSRTSYVDEIFGVLSAEERAEIVRLLDKLGTRLDAMGG